MNRYKIYTYNGQNELDRIISERDVELCIFGEIGEQLKDEKEICIDITSVVMLSDNNLANIYLAYENLRNIGEQTLIIIQEEWADRALELLPLLFDTKERYFQDEGKNDSNAIKRYRKKIYTYTGEKELQEIKKYTDKKNIPLITFADMNGDIKEELQKLDEQEKLVIMDMTSVLYAIEGNKSLIYCVEQLINIYRNIQIILEKTQVEYVLKYFPLYCDGVERITQLFEDIEIVELENEEEEIIKITSLNKEKYKCFIDILNKNLVGHNEFKCRFDYYVSNFRYLNILKEQKVFSIFLYGASGIGKTEVARLIAEGLLKDSYLPKINFQNYSSQDALNSLIGSPAGYVGCKDGELSKKIKKSKIGVLLCDEFEKATKPVFLFFLQLLEDGIFTDSMTREYDLDGYIIVFTSNIKSEEEFRNVIPNELITRFDMVCEFEEPSKEEKEKYVYLLLEKAIQKVSDADMSVEITEEEKKELCTFDYENVKSLRDIKRMFNNRFIDMLKSKVNLE